MSTYSAPVRDMQFAIEELAEKLVREPGKAGETIRQ